LQLDRSICLLCSTMSSLCSCIYIGRREQAR
jgi:hypothetical protein